jgi:mono/diheme cytochrome c family protein
MGSNPPLRLRWPREPWRLAAKRLESVRGPFAVPTPAIPSALPFALRVGIRVGIRVRVLVSLLVALAVAGTLGCSAPESPAARYAKDPEALKRGKGLFVGTCGAYCHGLKPGHRDAPYLFDCEWKHGGSDEEIFQTIRAGVPDTRMQGFADRMPEGDEDLWKIVAYIRSKASCP